MKKMITKILFTTLIIFSFASNHALADRLDLALKGSYFNYLEPSADVEYTGIMSGIQCSFNKAFSNFTIKARSEYMQGQTTYNGHVNTHKVVEGSAVTTNTGAYELSYDSNLWYTDSTIALSWWHPKSDYNLMPFVGIGYRYLNTPKSADIDGDYEREITYLYLPVTIEVKEDISKHKSWGFTGEIDILIHGWVKAHTSNIAEKCSDMNFSQSLGGGLKLASYYKQNLFGLDVSVAPFAEMWLLGDSDTDTLTYDGKVMRSADGSYYDYCEPANITTTLGLKFNVVI